MKETLYKRLIHRIADMENRAMQLHKNIMEYKKNNDYENAMKNDIKYRQLRMIIQELNKLID